MALANDVWDEVWKGAETVYSDKPVSQNQVFEHIKISRLREIFPKTKFKMLEVGCGSAFVSLYFSKAGNIVTCLDTNNNILRVAENNFSKEKTTGRFVVGNAEKLPFKNNEFDVVTSFGLLEHFKDPFVAISEMVRVTKPGGLFFADIVPNRFSVQTFGNLFNLLASFTYWSLKGKPQIGWLKGLRNIKPLYFESSMNWSDYKKIIQDAGIKKVVVYGNRPFPRLTLPSALDKLYASIIKLFVPLWKSFDRSGGMYSRVWGAGLWYWGVK